MLLISPKKPLRLRPNYYENVKALLGDKTVMTFRKNNSAVEPIREFRLNKDGSITVKTTHDYAKVTEDSFSRKKFTELIKTIQPSGFVSEVQQEERNWYSSCSNDVPAYNVSKQANTNYTEQGKTTQFRSKEPLSQKGNIEQRRWVTVNPEGETVKATFKLDRTLRNLTKPTTTSNQRVYDKSSLS